VCSVPGAIGAIQSIKRMQMLPRMDGGVTGGPHGERP
jgi:hypothetical protein